MNESALHAAREKQDVVRLANLEYAMERVGVTHLVTFTPSFTPSTPSFTPHPPGSPPHPCPR